MSFDKIADLGVDLDEMVGGYLLCLLFSTSAEGKHGDRSCSDFIEPDSLSQEIQDRARAGCIAFLAACMERRLPLNPEVFDLSGSSPHHNAVIAEWSHSEGIGIAFAHTRCGAGVGFEDDLDRCNVEHGRYDGSSLGKALSGIAVSLGAVWLMPGEDPADGESYDYT